MSKTETKLIEQNPIEAPLYTPWDAARYLHVPLWALFALEGRFPGWLDPGWWLQHYWGDSPHPLLIDDLSFPGHPEAPGQISFRRFTDLFVRAATLQVLAECLHAGEQDRDRWENLYHTIRRGLEDTHREPVPVDDSPIDERVTALVEPFAPRLEGEQLALLRKWFTLRLERVEAKDGMPIRIYPFSRDPAERSPRIVALDARIRFGRPILAERGVPTDILFERHQAGDAVAELAEDYDLTPSEVEEAIRYEALPPSPRLLFPGW